MAGPLISPRPASPSRVARMSDWREQQRQRDRIRRDEVMSLAVLRVRHHGILDAPDVDVLVCASIGPVGEAVAVWTAPEGLEALTSTTVSAAGARFPDSAAARPVAARITVHTPNLASVIPIADLGLAHITVQPMPGGQFLVAGARCRWRRDGPDRNGVLYDANGQVVAERVLGDGIGHVLATSSGQVWIGYFDEGIYGNYGWDQANTRRAGWRSRDRPLLSQIGACLALPQVHRGRSVGCDQRLLCPQRGRHMRLGLLLHRFSGRVHPRRRRDWLAQ
jgi:hypothetical protein